MKKTILQHYHDYPQAELQDLFKLLHQSEFGPGHLIADTEENFKRLVTEFKGLKNAIKDHVIDYLTPHLCRLHLQVLNQSSLQIHTLQRFFELSAAELQGNVTGYYEKIDALRELCAERNFPFNAKQVDQFKAKIDIAPLKPIRHSETYRTAYAPAYRVVDKKFCDVLSLFARIDELMRQKAHVLIGIDGDCAAGKTTLAGLLKKVYDCNTIHMDHFFLRPEQRTKARHTSPGGNIDHERFTEEVLDKLQTNKLFSYRPFNCMNGAFDAPIPLLAQKLTIIEGSYSHHPAFSEHYDLKVFLSIPKDVQLERILKRNGEVMYEKFKNMWIPMEKRYAEAFEIQKKSDLQFDHLDN
jgi:uridine kinase